MTDTRPAPAIDLLAGGFFVAWAAVGWLAYIGNRTLRASLFTGADPGPALLPLIVLGLLSLGGLGLVATGLWRAVRHEGGVPLPPASTHLMPAGFALGLLVLVWLIPHLGFRLPAVAFCLFWLWIMAPGGRPLIAWLLRLAAALAIAFGIHFLFAGLLGVPLPG